MTEGTMLQKSTENFDLSDRPLDPSMPHPILVFWDSSNGSKDPLGTTTELSGISGTRAKQFRTDPWGNQIQGSRSAKHDPFKFVGGFGVRWEPEVGLHHMGARWYDPSLGRFVSPDPLLRRIIPHDYTYVYNRPTVLADPTGLAYFLGCNARQMKQLNLQDLEQRLEGSCVRDQGLRRCLKDKLNSVVVACAPWIFGEGMIIPGAAHPGFALFGLTGIALVAQPGYVILGPLSFQDRGKPAGASLLHELVHQCGALRYGHQVPFAKGNAPEACARRCYKLPFEGSGVCAEDCP